jgi:hypothetical protein
MRKKSLFIYVLFASLVVGILGYFFQGIMTSLLLLLILPVVFKFTIGTTWRDSFQMGVLVGIITYIFYLFFLTALMVMVITGENTSGSDLTFAIFSMVIVFITTFIFVNWTGKNTRNLEPSLLDYFFKFNSRERSNKRNKSNYSIKKFIYYWIAFAIGYYVSTLLLETYLQVTNILITFIITGFIIELSAKILQMFLYNKNRIRLDKMFLVWGMIHSVNIWIVLKILEQFTIQNIYMNYGAVGLGLTIMTHIIWKVWYK